MESAEREYLAMAIGQHLGVGAVNGENFGLVTGAGGSKRFTGHSMVSRTEYGIEA